MAPCTPIQQLRKPQVYGMSIFDWTLSLLGAFILGYYYSFRGIIAWILFILVWVLFGVVVHYSVGVNTMFGYYLGLNPKPERSSCE